MPRCTKTRGAVAFPGSATLAVMAAKKTTVKKAAVKKTAVKKAATAKRAVPKVSALRGMSVDGWVAAKAKGWQSDVVQRIFDVMREAVPAATVSIKWGQPVFESNGPLAYVRVAKAHVTLGFWRGAELKDPKGVLEGSGTRMAHVKLGQDGFDAKLLTGFAKEAAKLNASKGDPTRRG